MKRIWTVALIVVVLLLAAGGVLLMGRETGLADPDAGRYTPGDAVLTEEIEALEIKWTSGQVLVETHPGAGIRVTETAAVPLSGDRQMRWWLDGTTLRIRYDKPGLRLFSFRDPDKRLTVSLPEGTVLKAADIAATSADVEVKGLTASDLNLSTTSGDLRVTAAADRLNAGSTSGEQRITLTGDAEAVSLGSTSGDIGLTADGTTAKLRIGATSGALSVDAGALGSAELGTTSGNIAVKAGAFDSLDIGATSGSVTADLPAEPGFTCKAEMTSGTFTSELPLSKNGNTYVCGDGSASCRIGTTSGDITLRGE